MATSIVVTGCGNGIGRALCQIAAARGMSVAGVDIDVAGGETTRDLMRDAGFELLFTPCSISDEPRMREVFGAFHDELDGIDVLVNNAAAVSHAAPEDIAMDEWRRVMEVNLTGTMLASQLAARSMIEHGRGGSIVNLSSIAGLAALGRGNLAYSTSKAGIVGLTRELAIEWAGFGIRVNAIAPSQVDTERFRTLIGNQDVIGGAILEATVPRIPLGRLARAEDIVDAVLFLAGESSSFITGVTLPVDGGSMALHSGGSLRNPASATLAGSDHA